MSEYVFDGMLEFFDARGGQLSPESDFGVHWAFDERTAFPRWRVSVVHDTGDVYAIQQSSAARVELLAEGLPHGCQPTIIGLTGSAAHGSMTVEHVTNSCAYRAADFLLAGYAEEGTRLLSWARERLRIYEPAGR